MHHVTILATKVTALLLEKWKAIPQPRLDRLHLLVPCLSQDIDRQVVVDKSAQMQSPKFASCWGESKIEVFLCPLLLLQMTEQLMIATATAYIVDHF